MLRFILLFATAVYGGLTGDMELCVNSFIASKARLLRIVSEGALRVIENQRVLLDRIRPLMASFILLVYRLEVVFGERRAKTM